MNEIELQEIGSRLDGTEVVVTYSNGRDQIGTITCTGGIVMLDGEELTASQVVAIE